jgi:hypothetical protein
MFATSTDVVDSMFHCIPSGAVPVVHEPHSREEASDLMLAEPEPDIGVLRAHPLVRVLHRVGDRHPPAGSRHARLSPSTASGLSA